MLILLDPALIAASSSLWVLMSSPFAPDAPTISAATSRQVDWVGPTRRRLPRGSCGKERSFLSDCRRGMAGHHLKPRNHTKESFLPIEIARARIGYLTTVAKTHQIWPKADASLDAVIRSRVLLIFSGAARTPAQCWRPASRAEKRSIDGGDCWTASSEC